MMSTSRTTTNVERVTGLKMSQILKYLVPKFLIIVILALFCILFPICYSASVKRSISLQAVSEPWRNAKELLNHTTKTVPDVKFPIPNSPKEGEDPSSVPLKGNIVGLVFDDEGVVTPPPPPNEDTVYSKKDETAEALLGRNSSINPKVVPKNYTYAMSSDSNRDETKTTTSLSLVNLHTRAIKVVLNDTVVSTEIPLPIDENILSNETAPIQQNKPESTAATPPNEPVSIALTPQNEPVSTAATPENEPVSIALTPQNEPVSTAATPENEPVSTTLTPQNEPVSTATISENEPVVTPPTPQIEPISTASTPQNEPSSTILTPPNEPVSTVTISENEPVATPLTPQIEPISTASTPQMEPSSTTLTRQNEPVSTAATTENESAATARTPQIEPIPPAATFQIEPLSTTLQNEPISTAATPQNEPSSTTLTPKNEPVSIAATQLPSLTPLNEQVSTSATPESEPLSTALTPQNKPVSTPATTQNEPGSVQLTPHNEPASTAATSRNESLSTELTLQNELVSTAAAPQNEPLSTPLTPQNEPISIPTTSQNEPVTIPHKEQISVAPMTSNQPMPTTMVHQIEPLTLPLPTFQNKTLPILPTLQTFANSSKEQNETALTQRPESETPTFSTSEKLPITSITTEEQPSQIVTTPKLNNTFLTIQTTIEFLTTFAVVPPATNISTALPKATFLIEPSSASNATESNFAPMMLTTTLSPVHNLTASTQKSFVGTFTSTNSNISKHNGFTTAATFVPIFHEDYEDHLLREGTSPGCIYEDRERFKRNLQAAAYSLIKGVPTMLSFSRNTSCVGILQKNGTRSVKHLKKVFPDFPTDKTSVKTAGFIHENVVLIDASPDQNVWTYTWLRDGYHKLLKMSKTEFLHMCNITIFSNYITAFAQVSIQDPTCILFVDSREVVLSSNATTEAISLAVAIKFMMDKEFITNIEAVFSWLDEPFTTSVFVYGSDGELYRMFRRNHPGTLWRPGHYEILPYSQFPLLRTHI